MRVRLKKNILKYERGTDMFYDYYDYYSTPVVSFVNHTLILAVAAVIAIIAGIVLCATFLKKSNEGKYAGFRGKLYNALTFNRFYAENIIKFVYIIAACIVTVMGIVLIVMGSFFAGIMMLVVVNIVLRISVELVLMFIILCRKTVSMDRRLSKIENFYVENYGDDWGGEDEEPSCGGCGSDDEESCGGDCGTCSGLSDLEDFHLNVDENEE